MQSLCLKNDGKKERIPSTGGLGKLTKSCPGKHDKRMPESIFNAICGQKPTKACDANLLNKYIFQVEKAQRYYFIQMSQCTVADFSFICSSYSMFVHRLSWSPAPEH